MLTISFSICGEEQRSPQRPDVGVWSCVQSEVVVHLAGVSLSDWLLSREDVFNSLSTCQSDMLYYRAALHRYCSGGTDVKALFDSWKQTKSRERHFCSPVQWVLLSWFSFRDVLEEGWKKFRKHLSKTWGILTYDLLPTLSSTHKSRLLCQDVQPGADPFNNSSISRLWPTKARSVLRIQKSQSFSML